MAQELNKNRETAASVQATADLGTGKFLSEEKLSDIFWLVLTDFFYRFIGESVGAFVFRVSHVSADPFPDDFVLPV